MVSTFEKFWSVEPVALRSQAAGVALTDTVGPEQLAGEGSVSVAACAF